MRPDIKTLGRQLILLSAIVFPLYGTPSLVRAGGVDNATQAIEPLVNRFAHQMVLRGKLGDQPIEMHLHAKPNEEDSVAGTYTGSDQTVQIQLAGEFDGRGSVIMEESVNGRDVSGEWAGTLVGNDYSGTWSTLDDTQQKPFHLTVVSDMSVSH
jgi:hypothetical protein